MSVHGQNLEKMRAELEGKLKRMRRVLAGAVFLLAGAASGAIPAVFPAAAEHAFLQGFQQGALTAAALAALLKVLQYRQALKDDGRLKRLYYQEHDERMDYVRRQVGKSSMSVVPVLMVAAALVAGYFSFTVFATLLAAALAQSLLAIGMKWYYRNRVTGGRDAC